MAIDIQHRIDNAYAKLSKSHRKIAQIIVRDFDKIAYMTASNLGKLAGVSEATVVRFAGKLGYFGYSEMQRAIQELVRIKLTPNQRIEVTKKLLGKSDIIENVMESDIRKIRFTLDNINRDSFHRSVEAILSSEKIFIIGARSSEAIARILYYNLSLIFDNVRFVSPTSSAEVFEQLISIGENDCIIAFSFPRYSSKVVNSVKFAKQKSAKVIVVTDSEVSPLAEFSTYLLTAQSDMASFMDSLVAPISIINAMIVEITSRREKEIRKRFDTLEMLWDEYEVYTKR